MWKAVTKWIQRGKSHFLGDDLRHFHVASNVVRTCPFCSICCILHTEAHVRCGLIQPGFAENLIPSSRVKVHKSVKVLFATHLAHLDGAPVLKIGPYVIFTDVWIQLCDEQPVLLKTTKQRSCLFLGARLRCLNVFRSYSSAPENIGTGSLLWFRCITAKKKKEKKLKVAMHCLEKKQQKTINMAA